MLLYPSYLVDLSTTSSRDGISLHNDILRLEWAKSRARAARAREEVMLLKEEMNRVLKYLLKYRKVTRAGIEPRTFWTYTRCSNQLSYLALEINQLILYLCNCQPKDTYSARHIQCHSLHT